jgi:hypothetical protein
MNKILFAFLTLLVIAVVALAGKMWIDSASRPEPAASLGTDPVAGARRSDAGPRPASAAQESFTPEAGAHTEARSEETNVEAAVEKRPAPVANEKLEMQKSLWVGAWGRQLPDPNVIDMDISQVGKPGGKAVPIPYVEPPPLASGSYLTNSDGTQSMVLGNTIVNADGSKDTIDGHQILKSDGTLGVMVGNDILWSDGSKSTR